ncbi:hypothetical protein [Streptomyces sp. GSL17-111]|uniref:hypothetical protein n=1 Tax=Streptomyces sp. GSL17-111 TaxID=3121596 RepID=UPI0030F49D77
MQVRAKVTFVGAAATALALLVPGQAHAESASCSTSGAYGIWDGNPRNPTLVDPLDLFVKDTKADGHHPAIRFVTGDYNGNVKYWPWRHNYDGYGNTKHWRTRASYDGGMFTMTVQVANFEGSRLLNYCTAPWNGV